MHIYCLGLNHNTTPIKLREQLSLNEGAIRSALARLACGHLASSIAELVIVSTCNRTELYAASSHMAIAGLEAFLSEACGIPAKEFRAHSYQYEDLNTARHLFEVAAGLDSLVVGEPQILGQIVRALELSRGQNMTGPVLNRLFQSAIYDENNYFWVNPSAGITPDKFIERLNGTAIFETGTMLNAPSQSGVNIVDVLDAYNAVNDPDLLDGVGWTPSLFVDLLETQDVMPAVESGAGTFNW